MFIVNHIFFLEANIYLETFEFFKGAFFESDMLTSHGPSKMNLTVRFRSFCKSEIVDILTKFYYRCVICNPPDCCDSVTL